MQQISIVFAPSGRNALRVILNAVFGRPLSSDEYSRLAGAYHKVMATAFKSKNAITNARAPRPPRRRLRPRRGSKVGATDPETWKDCDIQEAMLTGGSQFLIRPDGALSLIVNGKRSGWAHWQAGT